MKFFEFFFHYYLGIFILFLTMQQRYMYCNQEIIKNKMKFKNLTPYKIVRIIKPLCFII